MATKILGIYLITYQCKVKQVKNLISHDDFVSVYKVVQDKIYELEKANKFKETNTTKQLKKELKSLFGNEWFTDKSPLFYAITTNQLVLPSYQGGITNCIITKIN